MAKKGIELQKIELKVSVDCCDGCKKRVHKVLRNTEGVHKAEIDPSQLKVIVLGNVEPQSIVKKLLKAGKQAEILSSETQNTEKGKDAEDSLITTEQSSDKFKHLHEEEKKYSVKASRKKACHKQPQNDTAISDTAEKDTYFSPNKQESTFTVHKSMVHHHKGSEVYTEGHYYYMADPVTEALPYYAIHSYQTNMESFYQPMAPTPDSNIGDYFSDENTSGCHVM